MDLTLEGTISVLRRSWTEGIAARLPSVAVGQQRRGPSGAEESPSPLNSAKAAPGLFESGPARTGSDHAGGAGGFSPAPQLRNLSLLDRRDDDEPLPVCRDVPPAG
jgi:hypothetical protein